MKSLLLKEKGVLAIEEVDIDETMGPKDLKIAPRSVGICGSDVKFYTHGHIGDFILKQPMILGHEASGDVVEIGSEVTEFKVGDRVCMEPGIPHFDIPLAMQGHYNLDPDVFFWATPPDHGCMRETVIHPAALTYKLPENVSYAEGAMNEPMSIGYYAATKAGIIPGDIAMVSGAGTIGICATLAALFAGCSKIILVDYKQGKLDFFTSNYPELNVVPVNPQVDDLHTIINTHTNGNLT